MGRQMTFGVIVGNRGFFPSHLATSGRLEIVAALEAAGMKAIVLTPEETAHGAVETYDDAKKCAALFQRHAKEIDGIIITLPNFGEERGSGATASAGRCRSRTTCGSTGFRTRSRGCIRRLRTRKSSRPIWSGLRRCAEW